MKPELDRSEQIEFYGIKLHLNVHIYVSNERTRRIRCLLNVSQMNYSCSLHVLLVLIRRKSFCRRSLRPRETCIKFRSARLTLGNHLNAEMSDEDVELLENC